MAKTMINLDVLIPIPSYESEAAELVACLDLLGTMIVDSVNI